MIVLMFCISMLGLVLHHIYSMDPSCAIKTDVDHLYDSSVKEISMHKDGVCIKNLTSYYMTYMTEKGITSPEERISIICSIHNRLLETDGIGITDEGKYTY
jgi:hypothetical protein